MSNPFDQSNPYHVKVERWSSRGSLTEAVIEIGKEVEHQLKTVNPPIEVRVAAIEGFLVELGRLIIMAVFSGSDVDTTLNITAASIEFMRLDALHEAIELYELQKGSQ